MQEARPVGHIAHHQNAHQPEHRGNGKHATPHFGVGEHIEHHRQRQQRDQIRRKDLLHHLPEGFVLLPAVQPEGRHGQHHQRGEQHPLQGGEHQAILVEQADLVAQHHRAHQHQGIDDGQHGKADSEVMDECAHGPGDRLRRLPRRADRSGGTVGKSAGNQTAGGWNIAFIPAVATRRPPGLTKPAGTPAPPNRRNGGPAGICRIQA